MVLILIFAAVVLVFGYTVWVWWAVRLAVRRSIEIEATTTAYEQHPANSSLRILVAGDSTAVGIGAKSEDSIAGRVGKDFPQADIKNIGVSGLRLADLRQELAELGDANYDLVMLQIGANDILQRVPYAEVRKNLVGVLNLADKLGKRVVVMTAPNPSSSGAFRWPLTLYMTKRTRNVREIFMAEVSKYPNAVYIDLFEEKRDDPFYKEKYRYYSADLFHPNGEGYGVFYKKVKIELNKTPYL